MGWTGRPREETALESLQERTGSHIQIGCLPEALPVVREKHEAMRLGVQIGVRSMSEWEGTSASERWAVNDVFGTVEKWGKGRSFVEQDKASAVQCRRSAIF